MSGEAGKEMGFAMVPLKPLVTEEFGHKCSSKEQFYTNHGHFSPTLGTTTRKNGLPVFDILPKWPATPFPAWI